jgi:hypothetical protein
MKKFIDIVEKNRVSGFELSARNSLKNREKENQEFEKRLQWLFNNRPHRKTDKK